jgi:hypothetical protein
MNKKLISESYKERMQKLSGVKEVNKSDLDLLKESYFLTEQEMLNEGIKDTALAVMTFLTTVTSVLGQNPAQQIKQDLLQTNLKNKKEVVEFKKDLEQRLGDKVNTTDYQKFSQKLDELEKMVGKTEYGKESVTKYGNISIREFEYTFNLKNPGDKAKLDAVLADAKQQAGTLVLSNDTVIKMMSVVQPTIKSTMKEDIKINNQAFKNYNVYQADPAIVKDIANKIKNQFSEFDSVSGYILVHGSASNVPTTAFGGSNEALANARACSLATQLEQELGEKFAGKLKVESEVAGPDYANDKENTAKYAPYQFSNVVIDLTATKAKEDAPSKEIEQEIVTVKTLRANITGSEKSFGITINPSTPKGKPSSTACPVKF